MHRMAKLVLWSGVLWLMVLVLGVDLSPAVTKPTDIDLRLLQRLKEEAKDEIHLGYLKKSGRLRFAGTEPGKPLKNPSTPVKGKAHTSETAARGFLRLYGPLFGVTDQAKELKVMRKKESDRGRSFVRFQQQHNGVSVMAGELIVQMDKAMDIVSAGGRTAPDIDLDTTPAVEPEEAVSVAVEGMNAWYGTDAADLEASEPELWIYSPSLLGLSEDYEYLVWRITISSSIPEPIEELVLVDAHSGLIVLHFNQQETALDRFIYDYNNNWSTYQYSGGGLVLQENQTSFPPGISDQAWDAFDYAKDTYDFYLVYHGRDSRNGHGMPVKAIVRYCEKPDPNDDDDEPCPLGNAYGGDPMVFGDGWVTDDIFAHEYTHWVTRVESGLIYYMQPGAINEAFSDIWGEFVDLTNSRGSNSPGYRWLCGEDLAGGAIRDMKDPARMNLPDRMTSPDYYCRGADNGGVHVNSSIANKAAYLMVDGGTFNGKTVSAIGLLKTAKIFYEVQTNLLTSGSDYEDLYHALYQGCLNLMGTSGISLADCLQVRKATVAVEMNLPAVTCTGTPAPMCDTGEPSSVFFDDMENPSSGNWSPNTVIHLSGTYGWYYPQNPNPRGTDLPYVTSGIYSMWGDNAPFASNYSVTSRYIELPVGKPSYLHFKHLYDFGEGDGGVLEYQVRFDTVWNDVGPLFVNNGYNGTILLGTSNPIAGRSAFVGSSHGFIASRLNLASLAGKGVRFRFRVGNDESKTSLGWVVDDVSVHTCETSCTYDIYPSIKIFPGLGGKGNVTVATQPGCAWSATSNLSWVSVPAETMHGGQSIEYVVAANLDTTARLGIFRVAGKPFQVFQAGKITLDEALDNPSERFYSLNWFGQSDVFMHDGDAARSGPIGDGEASSLWSITGQDSVFLSFYWKVSSEKDCDFLTLNIDDEEVAAISGEIGWKREILALEPYSTIRFEYKKDGSTSAGEDCGWVDRVEIGPCYYALEPEAVSLPQTWQAGTVSVIAPDGCSWQAQSNAPWLAITSSNFGTGNGTVSYSAPTYVGDSPRTGTLTIGGQTFTLTQRGHIPIGEAVDYSVLSYATGGHQDWTGQPTTYFYDHDAAESGAIGDGETSWVETTLIGPVFGHFYWKVSSEAGHDYLELLIDGAPPMGYNNTPIPTRISGETDWEKVYIAIREGTHTIRWVYTKDGSGNSGQDRGWLDRVCFVLLDPTEALFGNAGGTGSVNITYPEEKEWKAISSNTWVTITSPASGLGSGSLTYAVEQNQTTTPRTGKIYIAGRDLVIQQAGVPCTYSLYPQAAYLSPVSGTGSVSVTAPAGCSWTASSDVDWVTVTSGDTGTGNGTVNYAVTTNSGTSERVGELEIADLKFVITQAGSTCLFTVNPESISVGSKGESGTVNVKTGDTCGWTAQVVSGYASWIDIASGVPATGPGKVSYKIDPNESVYPRTGWMIIAKHAVPVHQSGISCSFTLEATEDTVSGTGGTGDVMVTSAPPSYECVWTAESNAPWISINTGGVYAGSYSVSYQLEPNPASSPRVGTLSLAGQTFTLTQLGANCVYAISEEGKSFEAAGGVGSFDVSAPSGCAWRSVPDADWITVTGGETGSGKGTVTYEVGANPQPGLRAGAISLQDQTYVVLQMGGAEGLSVDLPRTGQWMSYDAGDDGDGTIQAGIVWPEPRFTNPDGTTPITGALVFDRLTGLLWTRDANAPGPSACTPGTMKNWADALNYVTCLNDHHYLGFDDWRLPGVIEMETLFHAGEVDVQSWLLSQGFSSVPAWVYWTSTTSGVNTNNALTVDTWGYVAAYNKTGFTSRVWPVRGSSNGPAQVWRSGQAVGYAPGNDGGLQEGVPWPMPRFENLGDCLMDRLTGLVWLKQPDMVQRDWASALAYADGLNLCASDAWRVPNRKELLSLIHFGKYATTDWLNTQGFMGLLKDDAYWSSTTYAGNTNQAWAAGMWVGELFALNKADAAYVMPVSGGMVNRPRLFVAPGTYDFGPVNAPFVGLSREFTLSNVGTGELSVDSLGLTGSDPTPFTLSTGTSAPCPEAPFVLAPGDQCNVSVEFAPETTGPKSTVLRITSTDPDHPTLDIPISGRGACEGDHDSDSDVDGKDLAALATGLATLDPTSFALNFGRIDCQGGVSGIFCMAVQEDSSIEMEITQSGDAITFVMRDQFSDAAQGTGSISGNTLNLVGTLIQEGGGFLATLTLSEDRQTLSGTYEMVGDYTRHSIAGTAGGCLWPPIPDCTGNFVSFKSYSLHPSEGYVQIHNDNGTSVKAVALPYGPHAATFTGHLYGKAGQDWVGYFVMREQDMTCLADCDGGDRIYGLAKSAVDDMIPWFSSPTDQFRITELRANIPNQATYYGDKQYNVSGEILCKRADGTILNYKILYNHLRDLHPSFLSAMFQAGNTLDPVTWSGSPDQNLIDVPFVLNMGSLLGQPQVQAHDVPGYPEYLYVEGGLPWMQIEPSVFSTDPYGNQYASHSLYWLVPEGERNDFKNAIAHAANDRDLNGSNTNYLYDRFIGQEWWWRAELGLGRSEALFFDYSGILSRLGDWWECKGDCAEGYEELGDYVPGDPLNDDTLVIYPINKEWPGTIYKPELYASPDVSYIVMKHRYEANGERWHVGEVLSPSAIDPVRGQMTIKWRLFGFDPLEEFQGMSYSLDTVQKVLKVRWQPSHVLSINDVILPPIPAESDMANGDTVVQYNGAGRWKRDIYNVN